LRAAGEFFRGHGVSPLYHVSFPYSVVIVKGERPPSSLHRSLDGSWYTFDWLRQDPALRLAVEETAKRAAASGPSRTASNAMLLNNLLQSDRTDRSSDLYDYWRALEDYWDDMDAAWPNQRTLIQI
jgi:hypothetical protein